LKDTNLLLRMLVVRQVKVLAVEAVDSVVEAVMTSEEVEVTSVVSQENLLNGGWQEHKHTRCTSTETPATSSTRRWWRV
jgi:hypothetical protein